VDHAVPRRRDENRLYVRATTDHPETPWYFSLRGIKDGWLDEAIKQFVTAIAERTVGPDAERLSSTVIAVVVAPD
jgi:hypothetical protein